MQIDLGDLGRGEDNPRLREFLRGRSKRQFANGAGMSDAVATAVQSYASVQGLNKLELIDALITVAVSAVQSQVPPEHWGDMARTIAEQVLRRLMVDQD